MYTDRNPAVIHQIASPTSPAAMVGSALSSDAMPAISSPMRTAVLLWKLTLGGVLGGWAPSGPGGATATTSGGRATVSGSTSSRCGLPQRWQNRASGGNSAPQVQNSGMIGKRKAPMDQFDAGSPTEASAMRVSPPSS